jgi:hypothetical protein
MKRMPLFFCVLTLMLAPVLSQGQTKNISGRWCTEDPRPRTRCVDLIQAFNDGGALRAGFNVGPDKSYAEGSGYYRGSQVVVSFRRSDNAGVGFFAFAVENPQSALAKEYNPDGGLLWQGRYTRRSWAAELEVRAEPGIQAGGSGGSTPPATGPQALQRPPQPTATMPGPVGKPSTTSAAVGTPIGCFADRDQRDLNGLPSVYASDANACVQHCAQKGFRYAAKQAGTQCFCGNSYGRYGPSDACTSCRGLSAEHCGGSYANFVWETAPTTVASQPSIAPKAADAAKPPAPTNPATATQAGARGAKAIGCFADRDQRDLNGLPSVYASDANACVQHCAQKGFRYAAKQAGTHCFCGNSYGRYGPSDGCASCRGLSAEHCGGSYANYVWEILR